MRPAVILILPLLLAGAAPPEESPAPRALAAGIVGTWEGHAAVRSPSVPPAGIPVTLTIAADLRVTGTVGDAVLKEGRFRENRGPVGRLFRLGTEFMIEGTLEGPLVGKDGVVRQRVRMPVDMVGEELRGDLNATGGGTLISVRLLLRQTDGG